jgi:hypothetical protein
MQHEGGINIYRVLAGRAERQTPVVDPRADLRIILKCIFSGALQGVKRPGRGSDHPPPSSSEFKERVEVFRYSPLSLRGRL